jgi:hypothetical protein
LSFTALADQRCSVLFAPTLDGPWNSVTNYPPFATSQLVQSVFPIAGTNGFFRLQLLP